MKKKKIQYVEILGDKAEAGILINDGKDVVIAIIENGETIIEIISVASGVIGNIIDEVMPLYRVVKSFFDDLFNYLPMYIIVEEVKYRKTQQFAKGKLLDKIFYMSENGVRIFTFENTPMFKAKGDMHDFLVEKNYLN